MFTLKLSFLFFFLSHNKNINATLFTLPFFTSLSKRSQTLSVLTRGTRLLVSTFSFAKINREGEVVANQTVSV